MKESPSHRFGEMIIVTPDEKTNAFGSFYVNSAATGNWEDFTAKRTRQITLILTIEPLPKPNRERLPDTRWAATAQSLWR